MTKTWLVPFDGSLNAVLRVLRLVRHSNVVLCCPSNLFVDSVWQCKFQQLQVFGDKIHPICAPQQSTKRLRIIYEPLSHHVARNGTDEISCVDTCSSAVVFPQATITNICHVDACIKFMDDLPHSKMVLLAEYMYGLVQDTNNSNNKNTQGASLWTMAWPYEWSSALSIDMCQDTDHVELLDPVSQYTGMQNCDHVEYKLSMLLDIWNTCINTLQEHFTYDELINDDRQSRHLLISLVFLDIRFALWSQPLDCPNAYPSNTPCCRNNCSWCCQVQQFVEENSVAETIWNAATE